MILHPGRREKKRKNNVSIEFGYVSGISRRTLKRGRLAGRLEAPSPGSSPRCMAPASERERRGKVEGCVVVVDGCVLPSYMFWFKEFIFGAKSVSHN